RRPACKDKNRCRHERFRGAPGNSFAAAHHLWEYCSPAFNRNGAAILLNCPEIAEYQASLAASNWQARTNRIKSLARASKTGTKRDRRALNAANKPSVAPHDAANAAKFKIGEHLLDRIGNTPLLRLERITSGFPNVEFFAKAEWFNPGGSVKDRAGYSMIRAGERSGDLRPGKIILDATSGNTGIAYAMIGAALGYRVKLCLPTSASPERKHILAAYGVEIVYTPGDEGTDGAIRRVREIYESDREKYFYPDQYSNPANPAAHYTTTAPEIWQQTNGTITHFVAGLGTTGTFVGATRRLKEYNP